MRRTLLIVFTLVVALQARNIDERHYQNSATDLRIEMKDAVTCAIKTNITANDILHLEDFLRQSLQTTDLKDRATRIGCFYACISEQKGLMSDAHWNVDKIKEMINSTTTTETNTQAFQTVDTCAERVKNETNKCDVAIKFLMCSYE